MKNIRLHRGQLLWAALLGLAACGGQQKTDDASSSPSHDAVVKEREPLTDADLAGLDASTLGVELPWTLNAVTRSQTPAAARATLLSAEVSGSEGFDRVVFTFSGDTPFPGYRVQLQKADSTSVCPDEGKPTDLKGSSRLVVSIAPGRNTGVDGATTVPLGTRSVSQARFVEAGLTCADDHSLTWAAGLTQGAEVRVMEFRKPRRLVVDVR
jgi:hypothetical protein